MAVNLVTGSDLVDLDPAGRGGENTSIEVSRRRSATGIVEVVAIVDGKISNGVTITFK